MILQVLINETWEDERALINIETKQILLNGDSYHNKIDSMIDGYLIALNNSEIQFELLDDILINPNEDIFKYCDFIDKEGDEEEDLKEEIEYEEDNQECVTYQDETFGHEQIRDLQNRHYYNFYIDHCDKDKCRYIYTQDILEAINKVRQCEGDLFDGDKMIYSCLGFGWTDNLELLKKYDVEYNDKLGFVKIKEEGINGRL